MKLAFTTLGCPRWDMETIAARAVEYGFGGVDFRGYRGELRLFELPEFTQDARATAGRLRDAGLEVPCFSSVARAVAETQAEAAEFLDEVAHPRQPLDAEPEFVAGRQP